MALFQCNFPECKSVATYLSAFKGEASFLAPRCELHAMPGAGQSLFIRTKKIATLSKISYRLNRNWLTTPDPIYYDNRKQARKIYDQFKEAGFKVSLTKVKFYRAIK